ncbi:MAG: adenosylhomocysteinase [Nitrososphaeraceae archaeon]|nr:adenosylhomocysteinase [Nitrososphaeraceae archaeon]
MSGTSNLDKISQGRLSYNWALKSMKIISKITEKYEKRKPLAGLDLAFCLHITKETSVLIMAARKLGGNIILCSANPLSVQSDILEFLKDNEIIVHAKTKMNEKEYLENIKKVLNTNPDLITDDGSTMHLYCHKMGSKNVIGGTEETTSGINRLQVLDTKKLLKYPIIGVNNAYTKYLFDNRYGTGQSTIDGILRTTNIFIPGKNFIILGYGWVGKGISSCLRGLGAQVTVIEVNPIRALEAYMDGYIVSRIEEVADKGDFFITCTGQKNVLRKEHIDRMKDGVFIANAGHFDVEIDLRYIKQQDKNPIIVRPNVDSYNINGKTVNLLSKGRVLNLVGGEGHSPEVMSLSFGNQLLSILYIIENHKKMQNHLYPVPKNIDNTIAKYALEAFGIEIDNPTKEQLDYHNEVNIQI